MQRRGPSRETEVLLHMLGSMDINEMKYITGDERTIAHATMTLKEVNNRKRGYKAEWAQKLVAGKHFRSAIYRHKDSWKQTIYIIRVE